MLPRRRSSLSAASLLAITFGFGLAMAAEACSGPPSDSGTEGLAGGSGSGSSCSIANLANANIGNTACGSNSLGNKAYGSSCTGNGGSPEYWCADFAKWAWGNSGADVGGLTPAAESFYTYGQAHGTLSNTPAVGDAVVFRGTHGIHHVAIVTQVYPNGTIESVSGDWGGSHGSQAHFASTAHVKQNGPAYPGKVGTKPPGIGMSIAGFISPYGMSSAAASACGLDAGLNDSSAADAGSSTEGGASGGEGGSLEGGNNEAGSTEGGNGEGGDVDGGANGDSGESDGSYAFLAKEGPSQRRLIELTQGATETVAFEWRSASGLAPPADLWIEADGRPALQLSSVGDAPFVRAGLELVPIRPGETYHLVFAREADATRVELVDATDQVLLHTRIVSASRTELVLPSSFWRTSITLDPDGSVEAD